MQPSIRCNYQILNQQRHRQYQVSDKNELSENNPSAFLIDSGNSVKKGGTGIAFDWKLIPKTDKEKIIVAGGINSSNVSDLLSIKHNIFGIDVNSGLESKEAIKDIEKIETFFKVLKKNGK